ncbi:MAG: hypothetical protein IT323_00980 [Anaerolineae bacterium]|nr:hypothetical protein [Anaerolineae bacterium]
MVAIEIEQKILEQVRKLDPAQQQQVLDFAQRLAQPKGEAFGEIFQHARDIAFPKEDLDEIKRLIEEDEERIDWDDWDNSPSLSS